MTEKSKLAMMTAASKALDYKKKNPNAEIEEILGHVMREVEKGPEKIGAIAAATKALKYRQEGKLSDRQILQQVMNDSSDLLNSMNVE